MMLVSSELPGLCLQSRLHILGIWNLLKKLTGWEGKVVLTHGGILPGSHFSIPGRVSSFDFRWECAGRILSYGLKKKVLGECQEAQEIRHVKRNTESRHFVWNVYGQLAFCTFQTNPSCMESLQPWEAGVLSPRRNHRK